MSTETWKDIAGYEGVYLVSSYGKVQSLHRGGRILAQVDGRHGYQIVHLCLRGHAKKHSVHRLVALAFIPNPLGLETVNHKDFDKTNNRIDNLEWMTSAQNNRHAYPVKVGGYRVDRELARRIFVEYYTEHEAAPTIAARYGLVESCVKHIVQRVTWTEDTVDLIHLIDAGKSSACARAQGVKRAYKEGRLLSRRGENNNLAKLKEEQVRSIRATYAAGGVSYNSLARQYKVCSDTIRQIVKRWIWAHLPEDVLS